MAVVVTSSLLVAAITVGLVFIPAVVGQSLCTNNNLVATGTAKNITSPNYPNNYLSYTNCQGHITADLSSRVVLLTFLDFYTEESSTCRFDYVAIYDGSNTSSPLIQLLCGQVPITQIISSGPSMTVEFNSNVVFNFRGFKSQYTSVEKSAQCTNSTQVATGTAKNITSPGYAINYPSDVDCQWRISSDLPSRVVVLKLLDFYLEASSSCNYDYVAIYDGSSTSSPRTQLLCGQVQITQFTSTGPSMTVVFHSDRHYDFRGFKFEYTSMDKSALCTNSTLVATGTAKYLTSPGYSQNYPSNMDCQWHITADLSSRVVVLRLLDFYLEASSSCNYDYVAIYDGPITSSSRIQLLCGPQSNTQFFSSGNSMTVVFHSDASNNYRGFKFAYTSLDTSALCTNTTLVATGTAKYITSPGYPNNYPSNMDCQWHITADLSSRVVVLKLLDFYLERFLQGSSSSCSYDYVAIYDGPSTSSSRIQLLCGQQSNTQFFSSGNSVTVVFHSDASNNFRGFNFEYTSLDMSVLCTNVTLVATGISKYITSPGYSNNYPSNMNCQWRITADLSSRVVVLRLLDFYLEASSSSCSYDYVAIYDGPSTSSSRIQLLCGLQSNTQFFSSGNSVTVVFHSDVSNNYRGFKFAYTSLDMSALCTNNTLVATGTAKYITSPGYPDNYPSYVDCQWHITADLSSHVVVLKLLDFYLEGSSSSSCSYDYVAIYNGDRSPSSRSQLLCGQISTTQFTSIGHSMTVVFHSDGSNNFRGFKFEYTSLYTSDACADGILSATETEKYLTSPGYPDIYPSNTDCQWHITADSDSRVVALSYSQFNVEESQVECTSDYVKIYDGPSTSSPLIKVMCGQMNDGTFASTDSDMTIVFHSDGEINFFSTGFKFTYQSKKKEKPNINYDDEFKVTDSLSAGIIVGIIAACIGLPFIIVVLSVCVKRMVSKSPQGNIPNRGSRPNRATGRGNSLFIVNLPTTSIATPPYAGVMDSQSLFDPPPYSSLNFTNSLPAFTPRNPSYSVSELPPYSPDLPGGTALNPQTAPLKESITGRAVDGVDSTSEGGAHLNRGFNFDNGDEVVRGHMTGQNVSADINPTRDTNMVAFTVSSYPPSSSVARNPSCSDSILAPSAPPGH